MPDTYNFVCHAAMSFDQSYVMSMGKARESEIGRDAIQLNS